MKMNTFTLRGSKANTLKIHDNISKKKPKLVVIPKFRQRLKY